MQNSRCYRYAQIVFFFFFQAEDGIRDVAVTGVQTCALPISKSSQGFDGKGNALPAEMLPSQIQFDGVEFQLAPAKTGVPNALGAKGQTKIGRASCRERV